VVDPFFLIGSEFNSHELGVDELLAEDAHEPVGKDIK
jgi:hypothetical protein